MKSIQDLRELRNAKAGEARKILDENPKDKPFPAEARERFDALEREIGEVDNQLERIEREDQMSAIERGSKVYRDDLRDMKRNPLGERAIFDTFIRRGESGWSPEQAAAVNTMSTTTGSEGGYTVQTEVAKSVLEVLKSYGNMRAVATVIQTSKGNPMTWPTTDGTAEEGEIVAENTAAADLDISFGTASLGVYKFSSKVVTVPWELLQDSEVNVEQIVTSRINERLGRVTNRLFTVGTGTAQPNGVVTALAVGKAGATGQTTTIIHDDLVDLIESIDDAYMASGRAQFMCHQNMRKVLRKLKDTAGRPLWSPGYEFGIVRGVPDQLMGYNITINNNMAVPAASAKSLAFGDFSKYVIRDVMSMQLFRFTDSAYTKKGQVGFLAWMRSGGNWMEPSGGSYAAKIYQHAAS